MEKTKAQQLVEVASWVKAQNPEFTKNFKSMKAIIKFYLQLPDDYDRKKSVCEYIRKGLKASGYLDRRKAERLALIVNTFFGLRYMEGAPKKYVFHFGLSTWTDRRGLQRMEVRCERTDRCCLYDDFKEGTAGAITVSIKSLGDAKRAVDNILEDMVEREGNDYEIQYGAKLLEAMKQDAPTDESLTVGHEIRI